MWARTLVGYVLATLVTLVLTSPFGMRRPEVRLNFTLRGIMSSGNPGLTYNIIDTGMSVGSAITFLYIALRLNTGLTTYPCEVDWPVTMTNDVRSSRPIHAFLLAATNESATEAITYNAREEF